MRRRWAGTRARHLRILVPSSGGDGMSRERVFWEAIRATLGAGLVGAILGLLAPDDRLAALQFSRSAAVVAPLAAGGAAAILLGIVREVWNSWPEKGPPPHE